MAWHETTSEIILPNSKEEGAARSRQCEPHGRAGMICVFRGWEVMQMKRKGQDNTTQQYITNKE